MPEDGWRQGLLPRDADGIGGVLGVASHEKLEAAFRRLESEVQHRRTSELLSGIERFQAERGDQDFVIEEGEEGEEEDSEEYEDSSGDEEEYEEEHDGDDGRAVPREGDQPRGGGEGGGEGTSGEVADVERLRRMIDDTESRRWNEIQSSTQSAVNALRVFLSRSTMLEEPIVQPRYRSMTRSRAKQIQQKQAGAGAEARSSSRAPRADGQSRDVLKMGRMLDAMEERLSAVDSTMNSISYGHADR